MAPNKTVLTFDAIDEQTALELPERELMCGCGSLVNINLGLCATANVAGINAQAGLGATVGTSGINVGAGAYVSGTTYSCG